MTSESEESHPASRGFYSSPLQILALTGAVGLIAVSAAFNLQAGLARGLTIPDQGAWAAASLAADAVKVAAPIAFLSALAAKRWTTAGICGVLACLTVAYSTASAISFVHGTQHDGASIRSASNETRAMAQQSVADLEAESLALDAVRPSARIAAEIASALSALAVAVQRRTDDCRDATTDASRTACKPVFELRADHDQALAAEALAQRLADAREKLAALPPEKVADPASEGFAASLKALGHPIEAATISPWLALLTVALVELGSAFGLVLVQALGTPSDRREASEEAEPLPAFSFGEQVGSIAFTLLPVMDAASAPSALPAPDATPVAASAAFPQPQAVQSPAPAARDHQAVAGRVMDKLKAAIMSEIGRNGGTLSASDRDLAASIGGSLGSTHRARRALEVEGVILRDGRALTLASG